jgi:hypothetical protein
MNNRKQLRNAKVHTENKISLTKKTTNTLFDRLNSYFELKHRTILGIILGLSILFSILLFDAKINMMGDDAEYIMYGYKFANNFDFPSFRGPLYPILLSPFIAIFGINIALMKILSCIMIVGALFFMYKTFYRRIPALLLFSCLTLLCINPFLLFYSSAILSEPFFLFIQSLLMLCFCKYFVDEKENVPFPKQIVRLLIIATLVLCLTLTRTVGYAAIGVIVVYFLFFGQWKNALLSAAANATVFGLFGLLKKLLWPASGSAYNLSVFFTKDMYNPDRGMEDLGGIIVRLFNNIMNYFSRYICQFLGLRTNIGNVANISVAEILVTIIIVALFLLGGYMAYRKNKMLFFAALHTLGFCLANFIILHAIWVQERFIIVYYPLILFIIFTGIYYLLQSSKYMHFIYLVVVVILFGIISNKTLPKVKANTTALKMYMSGNMLYGLTPDWQNYIYASQRVAKEVPESINIAVRKPGTSIIYGNRPFHGIYAVPSVAKDTLNTWTPASNKSVFIIDLSSMQLPSISHYLTFVAYGKTEISGVKSNTAGIYEINSNDTLTISALTDSNQIKYTQDLAQYRKDFLKNPDNLLYSPEILLDQLKNNNVRYMILASLRTNPSVNTGQIINTLHRYLNIMQLKYPDIAVAKYSIGNIEPATLYELKY